MDRPALPGDLPSRIRFRHLSCFVAIAQERNLRRAAERLHLSQPAVSKTLGELEALAGVQLVERGRQGARLTAAGEQFLRHAVGVTQALESATAALMGGEPNDRPAQLTNTSCSTDKHASRVHFAQCANPTSSYCARES